MTATETLDGAGTGWTLGAAWSATHRFGMGIELSRASRSERIGFLESDEDALAVLGGPRLMWSLGVVRPFARLLVGATRLDLRARSDSPIVSRATFDETHPTILMGGGVDYPLSLRWAVRVGYDYRRVLAPETFGQHWLSVAAVVKPF